MTQYNFDSVFAAQAEFMNTAKFSGGLELQSAANIEKIFEKVCVYKEAAYQEIVIDLSKVEIDLIEKINTGTSLSITGKIVKSQGRGQSFELNAHEIDILGVADPES